MTSQRSAPADGDMPGPRILIVDDVPQARVALRSLLEIVDLEVVGEAGDGAGGIDAARALALTLCSWTCAYPAWTGWRPPGGSSPWASACSHHRQRLRHAGLRRAGARPAPST